MHSIKFTIYDIDIHFQNFLVLKMVSPLNSVPSLPSPPSPGTPTPFYLVSLNVTTVGTPEK